MKGFGRRSSRPTILIVDDEPGIMEGVTMFLEMDGFRVLQASNGEQGLELLRREPCDLVMTDLMMPRMDGIRMIEKIRAMPGLADIPVILSSAALPPDSDLPDQADVFLCRPFSITRLLEIIGLLLEQRQPP